MKRVRQTKQKQVIESEVNRFNTFFTAEDLYNKVLKKDESVGIATVYRFLNVLKLEGKLNSYLCDRRRVYSLDEKSHCHFICRGCGEIVHFDIHNIDFLKGRIDGTISNIQLDVKGLCRKCSSK